MEKVLRVLIPWWGTGYKQVRNGNLESSLLKSFLLFDKISLITCFGFAIATSCVVKILLCGRNGRANPLFGIFTRKTMTFISSNCRPFWQVWLKRILIFQRPWQIFGLTGIKKMTALKAGYNS